MIQGTHQSPARLDLQSAPPWLASSGIQQKQKTKSSRPALVITQNAILEAFQDVQRQQWNVRKANVKDVLASANQALQNKQFREAFAGILVAQLFEDGTTRSLISSPEDSDNRLLGVESEDLKTYIRRLLSSNSP